MVLTRSASPVVRRRLTRGTFALLLLSIGTVAQGQRPVVPIPRGPAPALEKRLPSVAVQAPTALFSPSSTVIGAGQTGTLTATCSTGEPYVGGDASSVGIAFAGFTYPATHVIEASVFGMEPRQASIYAKCKITPEGGSMYLTDVLARATITVQPATATLVPNPVSVKVGSSVSLTATCSGGQPWIGSEGSFGGLSFGTYSYDFNARKTQTTVNGVYAGQGTLIVRCRIQGPVGANALSDVLVRAPLTVVP